MVMSFVIVLLMCSYCYAEMPVVVETETAAGRTYESSVSTYKQLQNENNGSRAAFESEAARTQESKWYTSEEAADLAQQSQTYVLQQKATKTLSKEEQQTLKQMKQTYKELKVLTP